ncbi:MAG: hypothetical protein ACFFE8_07260 [Candidatus Heimdallarchaeota archaeon]
MTVHSRRNKRTNVVRDIATDYWNEEKEETQKILKRKKGLNAPDTAKTSDSLPKKTSEKKKKTQKDFKNQKSKLKRSSNNKGSSKPKAKIRPQRRRIVMKKSREGKTRVKKRSRAQYFQRYRV